MLISARICKILPERTGTSENGSWSFTPMIIEFDEQAINGVKTHSARIELSGKTFKIDALKARCEDKQPVQMHLSLSVRKTKDGGYFTEVNAYPEDTAYRVPREY